MLEKTYSGLPVSGIGYILESIFLKRVTKIDDFGYLIVVLNRETHDDKSLKSVPINK